MLRFDNTKRTYVEDWFDLYRFGAIGDGIADDSAALLTALQAVAVRGGTVYMPPGTFRIASPIVQSYLEINAPYVELRGAGTMTILKIDLPDITRTAIEIGQTGSFSAPVYLRDFVLAGNYTPAQVANVAMNIRSGGPVWADRVIVWNLSTVRSCLEFSGGQVSMYRCGVFDCSAQFRANVYFDGVVKAHAMDCEANSGSDLGGVVPVVSPFGYMFRLNPNDNTEAQFSTRRSDLCIEGLSCGDAYTAAVYVFPENWPANTRRATDVRILRSTINTNSLGSPDNGGVICYFADHVYVADSYIRLPGTRGIAVYRGGEVEIDRVSVTPGVTAFIDDPISGVGTKSLHIKDSPGLLWNINDPSTTKAFVDNDGIRARIRKSSAAIAANDIVTVDPANPEQVITQPAAAGSSDPTGVALDPAAGAGIQIRVCEFDGEEVTMTADAAVNVGDVLQTSGGTAGRAITNAVPTTPAVGQALTAAGGAGASFQARFGKFSK